MNILKRIAMTTTSGVAALSMAGFVLVVSPATAAAETAAEAADAMSGDIIVTARKRAEDILKTPVAVSALTSEDIAKRGIVSINDVVNNTPGINVSNVSSGRNDRSFQQISLRGFTPSSATSTLTATFIDGVPVASATALNSVSDPERIEILRGPQAAYFGRNTFAGAVNVVTKTPGNDFGGSASVMVGTRDNYELQGAIEGAIVPDKLMFRVTGRTYSKSGSYKNGANPRETLGDQSTDTGTALILVKPSDRLSIKAFGLYSEDKDGPSAQGMLSAYEIRSNNGALNIPALSGSNAGTIIVPSAANCMLNGFSDGRNANEARVSRPFICGEAPKLVPGFSPAQNTLEDRLLGNVLANGARRVVSPEDGTQGYGLARIYYHMHLNVDYELGDTGITLSSLTGYNNEKFSQLADLDNYDSSLLRNPSNPTGANPNLRTFWDFPFIVERQTRDFSQEFRAAYDNSGPLTAILGVSYLRTRSDSDLVSAQGEIVAGFPRGGTTRQPPQKSITKGIFFGATYEVTEQLKISAEARYQEDEIFAFTGGNPAGLTIRPGNPYGLDAGTFGPLSPIFSQTFDNFLPRIIVQFEFNDDLMTYASWSEGANVSLSSFNTSFLNGSPTVVAAAELIDLGVVVQPETLTNYEVGLKGRFFDGRLRASLSAYYAEWKDQQNIRSILVQDEPIPTGTGVVQIVSGLANTGNVRLKGIELDLTANPIDILTINLAASMNDSNIRSFADPSISKLTGVINDGFRGNQLPVSSKYSANLGVQLGTDIAGMEEASWFVRGDLSYKSKQFADAANLSWIAPRTQVNFRAGVTMGPIAVEGFIINAFNNKDYITVANNSPLVPDFSISSTNGYLNVGLPELRTFGVRTTLTF